MKTGMKMLVSTYNREARKGAEYMPRYEAAYEEPESRRYKNGRFAPRNEGRYDMRDEMRDEDRYQTRNGMETRREPRYEHQRMEGPMNRIGFQSRPEMEQEYRMNDEYQRADEIGFRSNGGKMRGHASGADKPFDQQTAQEWVEQMKNEDGSKGAHWNMEQAKSLMQQCGIHADPHEFYAILNSVYSDYSSVAKMFSVNRPDFYAKLAEAWLEDKDAVEDKVAAYYEYVVKK